MAQEDTGQSYNMEGANANYGGDGIVTDISGNVSIQNATQFFNNLSAFNFVTVATRAVSLETTLYNPSLNLFAYTRLVYLI
jgi:hypothetical protein